MKMTIFCLLVFCAACYVWGDREATPEEIARFNEWRHKKQALANLDEYALAAVALDTNAPFGDRYEAIASLRNNPSGHLDALEALLQESDWALRYTAIDVIEPARTDLAYQAATHLLSEAVRLPSDLYTSWAIRAAALMAQMGDSSGLPFISQQLFTSPFCSDRNTAIHALQSYFYFKELKPYEPIIRFIDLTVPGLNSLDEKQQRDAVSSLSKALNMLPKLHAVEALPAFSRWLAAPMPDGIRQVAEGAQRELEALNARLENGEADPRDNAEYKRTPGVTPAWRFPIYTYTNE